MRLLEGAAVPAEGKREERKGSRRRHFINMNVDHMDYNKLL